LEDGLRGHLVLRNIRLEAHERSLPIAILAAL
jgi:hypothetical protein